MFFGIIKFCTFRILAFFKKMVLEKLVEFFSHQAYPLNFDTIKVLISVLTYQYISGNIHIIVSLSKKPHSGKQPHIFFIIIMAKSELFYMSNERHISFDRTTIVN